MTLYCVAASATNSVSLAVKPGTWQLKVVKIDVSQSGTGTGTFNVLDYSGATLAGTAVTPFPLRGGAAASTATAKAGVPTGTFVNVGQVAAGASSGASYTFPSDYILVSGHAIYVGGTVTAAASLLVIIFFEELHLARSF